MNLRPTSLHLCPMSSGLMLSFSPADRRALWLASDNSCCFQGCVPGLPEKAPAMTDRLSVLVAAGPFTTTDSVMYEPLADLVKALIKDAPDVAILVRG